jgi:F-type H+-transporting ATPase subunit epsilon
MSLTVKIITPLKVFLTSETEQLILPSITGGVGILSGHAQLITMLETGVINYKSEGVWTLAIIYAGFAEVCGNTVTIVVDGAEEISSGENLSDTQQAVIDATEQLDVLKQSGPDKKQLQIANFQVAVTKARLKAFKILQK